MKLSSLLIINAVLALGFAVGFVLIPGTMWTLYGLTPGPDVNLAGQFFGVINVSATLHRCLP